MKHTTPDRTLYDVQVDLDLDAALEDAVPPPTCEWKLKDESETCGAPATWILTLSCGHSYYFDGEHVERIRRRTSTGINECNAPPTMSPAHPPHKVVELRFERIAR